MRNGVALSILLITAACGDDGSGAPDAGFDAGPAPLADASVAPTCGVEIADGPFFPQMGTKVLFSRLDGTTIGTGTTNASGVASRDDCDGQALITLLGTATGAPLGFTVQVGAGKVATISQRPDTPQVPHQLNVVLSDEILFGGDVTLDVTTGSDPQNFPDGTTAAQTTIHPPDLGKNKGDVTVVALARHPNALGSIGGEIDNYDYKKNVSATEAGPVVLDGWESAFTQSLNIEVFDISNEVTSGSVELSSYVDGALLISQRRDTPISDGAFITQAHPVLPGLADAVQARAVLNIDENTHLEGLRCLAASAMYAGFMSVDFLAAVSNVAADRSQGDRHKIDWTSSNTSATYSSLDMYWTGTQGGAEWHVLLAGAATGFTTPELPPDFAALAHDPQLSYRRIELRHERLSVGGYDGVLAKVPTFDYSYEGCRGLPIGESRYTAYGTFKAP